MHGEGSYTYKKTGDIYSGSWVENLKHGEGRYEFGSDSSILVGTWERGQITIGVWELKQYANYVGEFKLGRPYGPGKFVFENGIVQEGSYVEEKGEEDEPEPEDGEEPIPPRVAWRGLQIVSF